MRVILREVLSASASCGLLLAGCGGHSGPTNPDGWGVEPPPGAVAQFTVSPLDLAKVAILTPLGNLNPPGHVLPTDHVYFYQTDFDHFPPVQGTEMLPVVAPADGTVMFVLLQAGGDYKVEFLATNDFGWYLDHLRPVASLKLGTIVRAGDTVGTTNPGGSLDLGAWDMRVTLPGLVNPARYGTATLHTVSPWKYFVEPLKSTIYSRIRRHPDIADKDGRTDFGIPGKLVGDWYEQSLPVGMENQGPQGWPKTIAFVYDYYDPRLIRISIGGTIAPPGIWTIPPDAPPPSSVSVSSGKIAYRLMYSGSTTVQYGLMLVQMLADDRIKIEVFPGSQAADAEFTAGAFGYVR